MMLTKKFMLAGKAIWTLGVPETFQKEMDCKSHYTFKIAKKKDADIWFVNLLTGPDNMSNYTYIGMVNSATGEVNLTRNSKMTKDSICYRLLNRVMSRVWAEEGEKIVEAGFTLQHEGKCGRCGRRLTTPESIASGFGPECIQLIG
jgi:hypothetical protein